MTMRSLGVNTTKDNTAVFIAITALIAFNNLMVIGVLGDWLIHVVTGDDYDY